MNLLCADALKDRVAFVTGATRGIGLAIAKALADAGAFVVGTATSEAGAAKITEELAGRGRGIVLDVTNAEAAAAALNGVVSEFGRLDVLVNNAGITRDQISMRMSDEAWDAVIATNLSAAFRLCRAAMRPMMKQRFGRMINITSVVGAMGNAGQANYAAAKAGLVGMSKSMAREVASRGVTINCVAPGFIDTDMTRVLSDEQKDHLQAQIPLGRLGSVDDIAQSCLFLASDAGAYITGVTLHVNGGMYMG